MWSRTRLQPLLQIWTSLNCRSKLNNDKLVISLHNIIYRNYHVQETVEFENVAFSVKEMNVGCRLPMTEFLYYQRENLDIFMNFPLKIYFCKLSKVAKEKLFLSSWLSIINFALSQPESYLEPTRTSAIEPFCKNCYRVSYFQKTALS